MKKTALAGIFLSVGDFFLFQGLHAYWTAENSQRVAKQEWEARNSGDVKSSESKFPHVDQPIRLEIPRLSAELFVGEGGDSDSLRLGPGHLRGSALPGRTGNCVIAGHRDMHFRVLKDIRKGDEIILTTSGRRFHYRVKALRIVQPTETDVLQPTNDAQLTLVTCFPFYFVGDAPKRFIVSAQLAPDKPAIKEM